MAAARPRRLAATLAGALALAVLSPHAPRARGDEARPAPPVPERGAEATAGPGAAAIEKRRWTRAVFFDLRGRGPSPKELGELVPMDAAALVDRLLADPATWGAWLDRELYYYLLI